MRTSEHQAGSGREVQLTYEALSLRTPRGVSVTVAGLQGDEGQRPADLQSERGPSVRTREGQRMKGPVAPAGTPEEIVGHQMATMGQRTVQSLRCQLSLYSRAG